MRLSLCYKKAVCQGKPQICPLNSCSLECWFRIQLSTALGLFTLFELVCLTLFECCLILPMELVRQLCRVRNLFLTHTYAHKYTIDLIPTRAKTAVPLRTAQSVIFWNHCQLFLLAFCIYHHSVSFYPWSEIFSTTKVSDKSSEISAFQTIICPKMIWTFRTMSVCVTIWNLKLDTGFTNRHSTAVESDQ